jgi:thioredoxin 1
MADYKKAIDESGLMVLDCMATWCGPCKVIAPKVVQMSNNYPDARFYKLDVDEVPDVYVISPYP